MSNFGESLKLTLFGQSHSESIGMTIEGIPAGVKIDREELLRFMARRAPGRNEYSTPRKEADEPRFTAGVKNGVTTGAPITAVIYNTNTRSSDYKDLEFTPRPGHADYTAYVKYGPERDFAGGGQFSGRLTAPLCVAGNICIQILRQKGIEIISRVASVGNIDDEGELIFSTAEKEFPTVSDKRGQEMRAAILNAKAAGDSLGGVVECAVLGLPAGLGGPLFEGVESEISSFVFGIPAVKGIEFGAGFAAARMKGSENNDPFTVDENGNIKTVTNNCGGILGGITNGMPLTFRAAFKPTPSIALPQQSVDLRTKEITNITVGGRHDPCVAIRAVPAVEAAAAVAILNIFYREEKAL